MPQTTSFSDYPTNVSPDAVNPPPRTPPTVGGGGNATGMANTSTEEPLDPQNTPGAQTSDQINAQQTQDAEREYTYNILFNFSDAKPRLMSLRTLWGHEINQTVERRLYRKVDINPRKLREEGKLKQDETLLPMRVIDTNIRRENPAYVNYLLSPSRQFIFESLDNPEVDSQVCRNIEQDVTKLLRYPGWENPHFKCMDGSQLHGWDSVEVTYDESKPGHVGLEHVGHDNLLFGLDTIDNQACEVLIRRYSVSIMQLRSWIKLYGFDPTQTQYCIDKCKGLNKIDYNFTIYKIYQKFEGVVYIAWCNLEFCDNWLKKPEKLKMGISKQVPVMKMVEVPNPKANLLNTIGAGLGLATPEPPTIQQPQQVMEWQDQDIVDYPIFINPYLINEEQPIMMGVGRGFLDKFRQEGMTAIITGFTNALLRSSNIYGSVDGDPSSTAEPVQLKTALNNGAIYDRKINFANLPGPNPESLTALEYLSTQNTEETGQVAIAAQNRLDSRKTAKEVEGAEQTQAQLSTVQVALYSTFLTKVGSFIWLILQSQALQNKIKLLQIPQAILNPQTGQQEQTMVNDTEMLKRNFIVKPAGSVDVIERQKMLAQMRQDWPVIQATPLAVEFFKEFIRQAYPQWANSWIAALDQANQAKQLVQKLGQMLEYLAKKDPSLTPKDTNTLKQVEQEVVQFLQPNAPAQMGDQAPGGNMGQQRLDSNSMPMPSTQQPQAMSGQQR